MFFDEEENLVNQDNIDFESDDDGAIETTNDNEDEEGYPMQP